MSDYYRYLRHATDIAGYSFQADIYCPEHIVQAMGEHLHQGDSAPSVGTEFMLDAIAETRGIDRMDERSYDSDDFPKVIFVSDVTDDRCGSCGEEL